MTYQQAAAKSRFRIAMRLDVIGSEGRLVLYNQRTNLTVIAIDEAGDIWREVKTETCNAYLDWEPAPDTLYEKWRRLKKWLPRVPRLLWLAAILALMLGVAHSQEMRRITRQSYREIKGKGWNARTMTGEEAWPCMTLHEAESTIPQRLTTVEGKERFFYRLERCGPDIPIHARRRACIGFTASWCDDSYSTKDVYEIWTVGMRVYWPIDVRGDVYGLWDPAMKGWPPRRWLYTICLGFVDSRCDVAYPIRNDVCYQIHQHILDLKGLDVAVRLGRVTLDCLPNWDHMVELSGMERTASGR